VQDLKRGAVSKVLIFLLTFTEEQANVRFGHTQKGKSGEQRWDRTHDQ